MKTCVIIAGGDLPGSVSVPDGALVICADCGYCHARRLGIVPDVLMGDFDSYTEPLPPDCPVLVHPAEKDDTDTALAVQYAAERGCTEFHIYGVFGGARPEHSIANLQTLHGMALQGLNGVLHHGNTTVRVQSGRAVYPKFKGMLSVFALTEVCTGVTLHGVKYPLESVELRSSYPLGVSNEITADFAEVSVDTGLLLIVQTIS